MDSHIDLVLPTFHHVARISGDRFLDAIGRINKIHMLLLLKFEALIKKIETEKLDPANSPEASRVRRILVLFMGFLLCGGPDADALTRPEILGPMMQWLKMKPL